jgi:Flp pilus assembly pilin Flp
MLAETLRRLCRNSDGAAAVELAIVVPLFTIMTLGITDLGVGISTRMTINVATQSGVAYIIADYNKPAAQQLCAVGPSPAQPSLACYQAIFTQMNQAAGTQLCNNDPSTLMTNNACAVSIGGQPVCQQAGDPNPPIIAKCVTVAAAYAYNPILPDAAYSWAGLTTIVSKTTARYV